MKEQKKDSLPPFEADGLRLNTGGGSGGKRMSCDNWRIYVNAWMQRCGAGICRGVSKTATRVTDEFGSGMLFGQE